MAQQKTASLSDEDLLYQIEALAERQMLVLTTNDQVVIDGLTSNYEPTSAAWACRGANVAFVKCTQKIVDKTGCAIIVKHGNEYCSKPCRD